MHWAAIATRAPLTPLRDPHAATALAASAGWTFASSVLPWRSCGTTPWGEGNVAAKTRSTLDALLPCLPREGLIWGGDWNHALSGREYAGARASRKSLLEALDSLGLKVPTADLGHQIDGLLSIDHIAIPAELAAGRSIRVDASAEGRRLSDHDAYVVDFSA